MSTSTIYTPLPKIDYPETDGRQMAETEIHYQALTDTVATLKEFFRDAPDIYVGGNLLLYYEKDNPSASTAPDVFVVKGVAKKLRRTYKLWEEAQAPAVVFEITSRSTRLEDQGYKRALYAMLGVREYFLFDPLAEYLRPPLQGYSLVGDDLIAVEPDVDGAFVSQELGLQIVPNGSNLRLIDLATGRSLRRPSEEADARRAAEERARAAEEEVERLRAELARLRGEQ
jgi:Uma2 family endonuclease